MTRAEEAALKAYPTHDDASEQWKKAHLSNLAEYIQGYEQAEKDTIERVIEWVKRNGYLYVNRANAGEFMEKPFVESLRKAMEEEV